MGGPIRVDWQAIKSRWASQYDDAHLFVLPKGFAQLVLAIQERLHWEATYRVEGYDFSDWDELQALVDLGLAGLTDSIMLQDLLTQVQSVEDAIFATACCPEVDWTNGGAFTDPVDEGVGLVPQPVVDSGYSTDTADWGGYSVYKCDAAHVLLDNAIGLTNRLAGIVDLLDTPLAIAGIIAAIAGAAGAIVTGGLTLVTGMLVGLGTAGSIWGVVLDLAGGAGFTDIVNDLEAARDDIVCAILNGDGVSGSVADVQAAISANVTLAALPNLYPWELWIRTLYAGRYDATDFAQAVADSPRFGSTCTCEGAARDAYGFYYRMNTVSGDFLPNAFRVNDLGGNTIHNGTGDMNHGAGSTNAQSRNGEGLGEITAGVEGTFIKQNIDGLEGRLYFYSSGGVAAGSMCEFQILQVRYNNAWHDVIGIEVWASTGTWVVDGNTVSFPSQANVTDPAIGMTPLIAV